MALFSSSGCEPGKTGISGHMVVTPGMDAIGVALGKSKMEGLKSQAITAMASDVMAKREQDGFLFHSLNSRNFFFNTIME